MADMKKLSLVHLERGLRLLGKVLEEEGAATEMVAVYLASAPLLNKAKKDPSVMEALLEQAAEMDGMDASAVVADFFEQCVRYQAAILAFFPRLPEEVKARINLAQGSETTT